MSIYLFLLDFSQSCISARLLSDHLRYSELHHHGNPEYESHRLKYLQKLCEATIQGSASSKVNYIFKYGYTEPHGLNPRCRTAENALVASIFLGITSLYQKLVAAGIQSVETWFGYSLEWPAQRGDVETARWLLENSTISADMQKEAMIVAAKHGHQHIICMFLDRKIDLRLRTLPYQAMTVSAARGGHASLVQSLTQKKKDMSTAHVQN